MSKAKTLIACLTTLVQHPYASARQLAGLPEQVRGAELARHWAQSNSGETGSTPAGKSGDPDNPLRSYFDSVTSGPGIWKWVHYFEVYHRHLAKFVGRPLTIVEVGVYSGGSLPMWRRYFGPACHIHGVDIQPECSVYQNSDTTIHIGDQADPAFWASFRKSVPEVDVLIDDGGHEVRQQIVTLEEMLPHVSPGGVYVCEDVHGISNGFATFAHALAGQLNSATGTPQLVNTTPFQAVVNSVHLYPFVVVIEKRDTLLPTLSAPKHGTQWQPFL